MIKFVKVFWIFSLLAFVSVLLMVYAYMPLQVVLSEDERGIAEYIVERDSFFYYALFGCISFNGFLLLLGGLILGLPSALLPLPKKSFWGRNHVTKGIMKVRLKNWLKGFGLAFNFYAMIAVVTIYDVNDKDFNITLDTLNFVIIGFLFIWVALFFYLFGETKSVEEQIN
jgi:hypothetical protein